MFLKPRPLQEKVENPIYEPRGSVCCTCFPLPQSHRLGLSFADLGLGVADVIDVFVWKYEILCI
jgi:hypothetical protein